MRNLIDEINEILEHVKLNQLKLSELRGLV